MLLNILRSELAAAKTAEYRVVVLLLGIAVPCVFAALVWAASGR